MVIVGVDGGGTKTRVVVYDKASRTQIGTIFAAHFA